MKNKILSWVLTISLCLAFIPRVKVVEASISNSTYTAKIGSQTIPFSDYPVGSYFTDNGYACNDHSTCGAGASLYVESACNCKCTWNGIALNSTSCYGFANMVFYRLFGHTTYSQTTKVVSNISASSISSSYLYSLFTNGTVKPGAHIRNSTHSMIYMGCDTSYIYTYEGNYDGHCKVGVIRRTWDGMSTYLKGKSGISYIQMPNSYPNTTTESPTATLSVNRQKYNPNDIVTFTFGGNNSGTYTLAIYKDYDRIDTVTVVGNTYSRKFETGMYSAYMTAYNDTGYADSNWVDWQVNDLTAYLYVNSDSFAIGDNVTLTFDGNNSLKYSNGSCTLGIFKDGNHYDTVTVYDEVYTRSFNEAGEYSAYMTAYSETEYKDSNWVYWTVKEWPSAPVLSCPDLLYDVNNYLTFEWNECQNADYYDFWVYKGDEAIHTTCYIDGLSHKLKLPEGTYKAKVASVNRKYSTWTWSNEYEFTVVNNFPERPILSVNNSEFQSGDNIILSWNDCANADDYDFYIYDDDGNVVLTEFYYKQLTKNVTLPQGRYVSKVASVNRTKGTWLWSNEVEFEVKEKEIKTPGIDCTVKKDGELYSINVDLINIDDSCEIFVAGYKGGKFVTANNDTYSQSVMPLTLVGDIDEIKVMVVNNLSNIKPLCKTEIIPSSEWTIK